MENRSFVRKLAAESAKSENPLGWFEILYRKANEENLAIPWDDNAPNPNLVEFCQSNSLEGRSRTALKIGCGFGHDAEYLQTLGFQVTGFDLAPSAIAAAKAKFPKSKIRYLQEDLFNFPNDLIRAHDFVLESYTLQAIPKDIRRKAVPVIASLVKPGGELLVITRGREENDLEGKLPFPLPKSEMFRFKEFGLKLIQLEDYFDHEEPPLRRFRAHFKKEV